jgi:ClpP class serine protease
MIDFPHLAQRLFNTPLAIHPRKAEVVMAALAERLGITQLVRLDGQCVAPSTLAFYDDDDEGFTASKRTVRTDDGYDLIGPVARIPISGTLVHKLGSLRPSSGMTGYDGIRQSFLSAITDDDVKAVMLDIDSGGGEVAGCFDLVDEIYAWRGSKPIWSILTESAYSAAYVLASGADKVVTPRTGGTGSNATICMRADLSEALTKAGVKVTFITSEGADRKTDLRAEVALTDDAFAAIKAEVDAMGDLLHDTVGRNRGIAASAVRGQKAATYMGAAGIEAGLADAVMSPDAAFRALLATVA